MAFVRPQPSPPVVQSNTWWCWAACLEMLNRAHPERFGMPIRRQNEWVAAMRASPAANRLLSTNDGLNVHYFPQVLTALGMEGHQWRGGSAGDPVDLSFIELQLQVSYLWAVFPVPGGSHFVVIYGVENGRPEDGLIVRYFNPAPGVGYAKANQAQVQRSPLLIGWKR